MRAGVEKSSMKILARALVGLMGLVVAGAVPAFSQDREYDLLIRGGHVIDPKSRISAVRDVAIKDGRIAAVAANIPATRALKAVRYQKFNVHRRLRPEALAGWMYQRRTGDPTVLDRLPELAAMEAAFAGSIAIGDALDAANGTDNWLLPMAFPEGSPTHPSYGAGHATVAGACVTILKAWFDHGWPMTHAGSPIAFEPEADGSALVDVSASLDRPLHDGTSVQI